MYIKRLYMENIKGFSHIDFNFDRGGDRYAGWTVFTGDNGSGKSSLLKAITIALTGKETARSLQPSFRHWIRNGESEGCIQLEIVRVDVDDTVSDPGKRPAKSFPANITLSNGAKEPVLQVVIPKGKRKSYTTPDRTIWSFESHGWFSCGYGPFRRILGASPEAQREMVAPNTERYVTRQSDHVLITNRQEDLPTWFELHPTEAKNRFAFDMMNKLNVGYEPGEIMDGPNLWRLMTGDRLVWVGESRSDLPAVNHVIAIVDFHECALVVGESDPEAGNMPLIFGEFSKPEQSPESVAHCRSALDIVRKIGMPRTLAFKWALG